MGSKYSSGCVLAALIFWLAAAGQGQALDVDVKIVLAVDASGSVDRDEFALQIAGIAAALRAPALQKAVRAGYRGQVSAAVVIWSDAAFPKHPTKWVLLRTPASFEALARQIEALNRRAPGAAAIGGGGTNIGAGLAYAVAMIAENPARAPRLVVDISGDGPNLVPWLKGAIRLPAARAMARRAGVTVNALAIENEEPALHLWYRRHLILGPGAFVERASDYSDFARAILKKLLRELASAPLAGLRAPRSGPPPKPRG